MVTAKVLPSFVPYPFVEDGDVAVLLTSNIVKFLTKIRRKSM